MRIGLLAAAEARERSKARRFGRCRSSGTVANVVVSTVGGTMDGSRAAGAE